MVGNEAPGQDFLCPGERRQWDGGKGPGVRVRLSFFLLQSCKSEVITDSDLGFYPTKMQAASPSVAEGCVDKK